MATDFVQVDISNPPVASSSAHGDLPCLSQESFSVEQVPALPRLSMEAEEAAKQGRRDRGHEAYVAPSPFGGFDGGQIDWAEDLKAFDDFVKSQKTWKRGSVGVASTSSDGSSSCSGSQKSKKGPKHQAPKKENRRPGKYRKVEDGHGQSGGSSSGSSHKPSQRGFKSKGGGGSGQSSSARLLGSLLDGIQQAQGNRDALAEARAEARDATAALDYVLANGTGPPGDPLHPVEVLPPPVDDWTVGLPARFTFESSLERVVPWKEVLSDAGAFASKAISDIGLAGTVVAGIRCVSWLSSLSTRPLWTSLLPQFAVGVVGAAQPGYNPFLFGVGSAVLRPAYSWITRLLARSWIKRALCVIGIAIVLGRLGKRALALGRKYVTSAFSIRPEGIKALVLRLRSTCGEYRIEEDHRQVAMRAREVEERAKVARVELVVETPLGREVSDENIDLELAMELLGPKYDVLGVALPTVYERIDRAVSAIYHIATDRSIVSSAIIRRTVDYVKAVVAHRHAVDADNRRRVSELGLLEIASPSGMDPRSF